MDTAIGHGLDTARLELRGHFSAWTFFFRAGGCHPCRLPSCASAVHSTRAALPPPEQALGQDPLNGD